MTAQVVGSFERGLADAATIGSELQFFNIQKKSFYTWNSSGSSSAALDDRAG